MWKKDIWYRWLKNYRTAGEKKKGQFSYDLLQKMYLGEELSKEEQQSDWSEAELADEQLQHAARDAEVPKLLLHPTLKGSWKRKRALRDEVLKFRLYRSRHHGNEWNGYRSVEATELLAEELLAVKVNNWLQLPWVQSFLIVNLNSPKQAPESLPGPRIKARRCTSRDILKVHW